MELPSFPEHMVDTVMCATEDGNWSSPGYLSPTDNGDHNNFLFASPVAFALPSLSSPYYPPSCELDRGPEAMLLDQLPAQSYSGVPISPATAAYASSDIPDIGSHAYLANDLSNLTASACSSFPAVSDRSTVPAASFISGPISTSPPLPPSSQQHCQPVHPACPTAVMEKHVAKRRNRTDQQPEASLHTSPPEKKKGRGLQKEFRLQLGAGMPIPTDDLLEDGPALVYTLPVLTQEQLRATPGTWRTFLEEAWTIWNGDKKEARRKWNGSDLGRPVTIRCSRPGCSRTFLFVDSSIETLNRVSAQMYKHLREHPNTVSSASAAALVARTASEVLTAVLLPCQPPPIARSPMSTSFTAASEGTMMVDVADVEVLAISSGSGRRDDMEATSSTIIVAVESAAAAVRNSSKSPLTKVVAPPTVALSIRKRSHVTWIKRLQARPLPELSMPSLTASDVHCLLLTSPRNLRTAAEWIRAIVNSEDALSTSVTITSQAFFTLATLARDPDFRIVFARAGTLDAVLRMFTRLLGQGIPYDFLFNSLVNLPYVVWLLSEGDPRGQRMVRLEVLAKLLPALDDFVRRDKVFCSEKQRLDTLMELIDQVTKSPADPAARSILAVSSFGPEHLGKNPWRRDDLQATESVTLKATTCGCSPSGSCQISPSRCCQTLDITMCGIYGCDGRMYDADPARLAQAAKQAAQASFAKIADRLFRLSDQDFLRIYPKMLGGLSEDAADLKELFHKRAQRCGNTTSAITKNRIH